MYRIEKVKSDALALKEIYKEIPSYRDSYLCESEFPGYLELIKSKVNEVSEKLEDLRTIFTEDN